MRRSVFPWLALLLAPLASAESWDGWIVGAPCANAYQVADCPLRHVDRPVLLLEDGRVLAFQHGEGKGVTPEAIDKAYGKKVRLSGELRQGELQPLKLDLLEVSGERKFFKGCL